MSDKNRYCDSTKAHHTLQGFQNIEPFYIRSKDIQKWKRQRHVKPPQAGYEQFNIDWFQEADFCKQNDAIWWLGHATALIRINQKMILTDPIFSSRASPITFAGPKRRTPCASSINKLPHIDFIVISHNHYDHLDYSSIKQLIKRFPLVTIVVPLGLKDKIYHWGAKHVVELDWWQNIHIDGTTLTAMPAKHWSRRALFDTNRSLWCGWMIERANRCIYFVGDTGFSTQFCQVKQRFPHIDIALIPIGCYAPRWFMHHQHIDPLQAIQLFHDIGCKRAIAIHWGAFELADEPLDEPPKLLKQLLAQNSMPQNQFLVIKMGQSIGLD